MVLLDKLWDDIVAGPQPDRGLGKLRKLSTPTLNVRGLYALAYSVYIHMYCSTLHHRVPLA